MTVLDEEQFRCERALLTICEAYDISCYIVLYRIQEEKPTSMTRTRMEMTKHV